jgi:diguanylate cyclase (GGDEF)-like protein
MTMAQMFGAIVLITVLMHYAKDMRGSMLSIYFMIMTFAVFALGRGKMIAMSAVITAAFSTLITYEYLHAPEQLILAQAIGQLLILMLGLAWFVYVGGYIHNLQLRIREQRESLRDNQLRLEESNQQLRDAMGKLAELAIRDHLTDLYNRRYFIERLEEIIANSERSHDSFHLALIDLDNFKQVNDQYGHQVGDDVLMRFAQVAYDSLRRTDVLARYGGEEFIVLFPQGSTAGITEVLERLRKKFAELSHDDLIPGLQVTLSTGLTAWQQGDDANSLIQRADKALYKAKDLGRNRLHVI